MITKRGTAILLATTIGLAACGDSGSSGLNPFRWFGGGQKAGPTTLDPEGGYASASDRRQPFPRLTGARWESIPEGRMLVVTGVAPTKGWWDIAILTEEPMPEGRIRGDQDGILRLRMVGMPPLPEQPEARMPANPAVDTITASFTLTSEQLARLRGVVVSGASNSFSLKR